VNACPGKRFGSRSPACELPHASSMSAVHLAMGTIRFDPALERTGPSPDALVSRYAVAGGDVQEPLLAALTVRSGSEWTCLRGDGNIYRFNESAALVHRIRGTK
jgi:hypothetical protein